MGVSINQFRFQKPGIHYQKSDQEKVNYPKQSAVSVDLKDYPEGNEIIGCHFAIKETLYNGHNVKVAVEFYDDDSGDLLWKGTRNIPQPSDSGYAYWNYYNYYFWIGHLQWEIRKAMTVRMECYIWGDPIGQKTVKLKMQVTDSTYVAPDPDDPVAPVKKGKRVEFYYKDSSKLMAAFNPGAAFIGGGVSKLIENKGDIEFQVNKVMPLGYKLIEVDIDPDKVSLKFEETGSVFVVLAIVAAVIAVLLIFGLIVTSWKVFDWKKEEAKAEQEEEETDQQADENELVKYLVEEGIITSTDDAVRFFTALGEREEDPPDDPKDIFEKLEGIIIIAVGAVIIMMLIQQMGKGGT